LQFHRKELALFGHAGEDLLLDRGRFKLNAVKNLGVEDVRACVDFVGHKHRRLLDKALDLIRAGLVDDDTILAGLVDLGHEDRAFLAVVFVELRERERERESKRKEMSSNLPFL